MKTRNLRNLFPVKYNPYTVIPFVIFCVEENEKLKSQVSEKDKLIAKLIHSIDQQVQQPSAIMPRNAPNPYSGNY